MDGVSIREMSSKFFAVKNPVIVFICFYLISYPNIELALVISAFMSLQVACIEATLLPLRDSFFA